jgi:hypothetical protein
MTRTQTPVRPTQADTAGPRVHRERRWGMRALRAVGAALVIATGAIHLYLYQDSYSGVPTIGRLFVANFAVGLVLGLVILATARRVWPVLGAAFCLGTLAAFLISVQWGLFGFQETLRGAWQERAAVVEIAGGLVNAAAALRRL